MVLAGMLEEAVKRKAREEGREEGRKEGFEEGLKEVREERRRRWREERRKRWEEAYAKFGVEVDGVLMLPMTPEVERFLEGETEE